MSHMKRLAEDLDDDRLDALAAELDAIDLGDARLVSDPELTGRVPMDEDLDGDPDPWRDYGPEWEC